MSFSQIITGVGVSVSVSVSKIFLHQITLPEQVNEGNKMEMKKERYDT
jgi:hypothetical protein